MIGCPGSEAVVGVEVHGVDVPPPLGLLQSHGGLVGGEDWGGKAEAPVNREPEGEYLERLSPVSDAALIFKY